MAANWKTRRNRRKADDGGGSWVGGVARGLMVGVLVAVVGVAALLLSAPPAERDAEVATAATGGPVVEDAALREARGRSGPGASQEFGVASIGEDAAVEAPGAVPRVAAPSEGPSQPRVAGVTAEAVSPGDANLGVAVPSAFEAAEGRVGAEGLSDGFAPMAPPSEPGPALRSRGPASAETSREEDEGAFLGLDPTVMNIEEARAALAALEAEAVGTEDTGIEDTGTEDTGTEDVGTEDVGAEGAGQTGAWGAGRSVVAAEEGDAVAEVAMSPSEDETVAEGADAPRATGSDADIVSVAAVTPLEAEEAPLGRAVTDETDDGAGPPLPTPRPTLVDRTGSSGRLSGQPVPLGGPRGEATPLAVVLTGAAGVRGDWREGLPGAVTFSIPAGSVLDAEGREVVLRVASLGGGRLATRSSAPEGLDALREAVGERPEAVAVMLEPGTAGTARLDPQVLSTLAELGIGYLESRPVGGAAAVRRARRDGIAAVVLERGLADNAGAQAMLRALEAAAGSARRRGAAVIALPAGEAAAEALRRWVEANADGPVALAPLSTVLAAEPR